jgi:hypothetical protein
LGLVVGCSLGGERWDGEEKGEEKGEIEEENVGRLGIYWLLPMESPKEHVHRYTLQWVRRWQCHVTVRKSRFESLGHSVGKIVWKKSTSSHRCNFPEKLYNMSVIRSVYTDRIGDGIIAVGKSYRRKKFVGNFVGFRRFSGSVKTSWLLNFATKKIIYSPLK